MLGNNCANKMENASVWHVDILLNFFNWLPDNREWLICLQYTNCGAAYKCKKIEQKSKAIAES